MLWNILKIWAFMLGVCSASNCHSLQKSQMASLNERMNQMINSLYSTSLLSGSKSESTDPSPSNFSNTPMPQKDYSCPYDDAPSTNYGAPPPPYPPSSYRSTSSSPRVIYTASPPTQSYAQPNQCPYTGSWDYVNSYQPDYSTYQEVYNNEYRPVYKNPSYPVSYEASCNPTNKYNTKPLYPQSEPSPIPIYPSYTETRNPNPILYLPSPYDPEPEPQIVRPSDQYCYKRPPFVSSSESQLNQRQGGIPYGPYCPRRTESYGRPNGNPSPAYPSQAPSSYSAPSYSSGSRIATAYPNPMGSAYATSPDVYSQYYYYD